MRYYSTGLKSAPVSLAEAVTESKPSDGGLYMPEKIPLIPAAFINNLPYMTMNEIGFAVTNAFIGSDIEASTLKNIVDDTFKFEIPLKRLSEKRTVLELFHGPTLAFKDIGARFMAGLMKAFGDTSDRKLNVIVSTTGNTGAAVAEGFRNATNVNVFLLFPSKSLPRSVAKQIAGHAGHIYPVEVAGTIDDCRKIAASAFDDDKLRQQLRMTSANSTNIARLIPQIALFYHAAARLGAAGIDAKTTDIAIPSGNLSLVTSAVMAKRSGLAFGKIIAACNANNAFDRLVRTGETSRRATVRTLATFMDIAMPSNLDRLLDLYGHDIDRLRDDIITATVTDELIRAKIDEIKANTGYVTDPHTAVALVAADMTARPEKAVLSMGTADPSKTADIVGHTPGSAPLSPEREPGFKATIIAPTYPAFRKYLLAKQ